MIVTSSAREQRERVLTIGTWLVGIGAILLVKDAMRWDWGVAWPLWLILAGTAGAVTTLFTIRRRVLGLWGIGWPLLVAAVGFILLLSTTGSIEVETGELIRWWPIVAIATGLWFVVGAFIVRQTDSPTDVVAMPLDGLAEAEVTLKFGGGELVVGQAQPGTLVSGRFDGGVVHKTRGHGRVELSPADPGLAWFAGRPMRWEVGITPLIPVNLRLDTGANRSSVDLSALRIRQLELHTGASETTIRLPATGQTSVRVEAGLASVTLRVPDGVAARVRGKVAIGSTSVDERRFPRLFEGWSSTDYESAANRVDIDIDGGLGSVRIE